MTFNEKKIPDELVESCKKGKCILFIGAGLSIAAGFPDWKGLIEELISEAQKESWLPKDKIRDYKKLVKDSSKHLHLAEDLKEQIPKRFYDYIDSRFGQSLAEPTDVHLKLMELNAKCIITINYDSLLEKAYNKKFNDYPNVYTYKQSKEAANNIWKNRFFILKAHGDAKSDPNGVILSQKDYRTVLYREPGYRSILQVLFSSHTILFLGVSLNDPEFNQLLDFLHDSYHGGGPIHYVLLNQNETPNTLAKRYMDEFNLHTIKFNPQNNYSEILEFVELLNDKVKK